MSPLAVLVLLAAATASWGEVYTYSLMSCLEEGREGVVLGLEVQPSVNVGFRECSTGYRGLCTEESGVITAPLDHVRLGVALRCGANATVLSCPKCTVSITSKQVHQTWCKCSGDLFTVSMQVHRGRPQSLRTAVLPKWAVAVCGVGACICGFALGALVCWSRGKAVAGRVVHDHTTKATPETADPVVVIELSIPTDTKVPAP
eukprot:Sspe_Gene.48353::Locus_25105_Transcript_1_1_Confidence_1.000_Length_1009::g.48353::m.48353